MKGTVLLVEDDPDIRILLSLLLVHGGFEVVKMESAEHALDWLKMHVPDLIISDIFLPGIPGTGLMERVRQNPKLKHVCAIAVSAFASVEDKYKIMQSGFNDFLPKPVEATMFVDQVKEIYERSEEVYRL